MVVSDVHIRYEDNIIDQNNPFAIGITIEKLAVESANEKWVKVLYNFNSSLSLSAYPYFVFF